jgi:hypothetical protein
MSHLKGKNGRRRMRKLHAARVAATAGLETIALASLLRQGGRGRAYRAAAALAGAYLAERAHQRHAHAGRR